MEPNPLRHMGSVNDTHMNQTNVEADCRCAEMQCCLRGKSDDGKMIFSQFSKKMLKNSHCRVRYFLKGIKISDGIYTYLLLKHNSDMENEKKGIVFHNANIAN